MRCFGFAKPTERVAICEPAADLLLDRSSSSNQRRKDLPELGQKFVLEPLESITFGVFLGLKRFPFNPADINLEYR